MKIQYASDLHLEFAENSKFLRENPLMPTGDVLVLAGDICYFPSNCIYGETEIVGTNAFPHRFWDWASENFEQVVCVVGNHELYNYYNLKEIPKKIEVRHNVNYYYNTVIQIDNTDFIVSTLWAKISPENAFITQKNVSDFYRIIYGDNLLTANDFNVENERCANFIKESVANSKAEKIIVVTHHVPSFALMAIEFKDSRINSAFTYELGNYIADSRIDYWIYGHSHRNIDNEIGNTKCLTNQLGYVSHNENLTFESGKMIEDIRIEKTCTLLQKKLP
jgi:predicted phosphodiesterase